MATKFAESKLVSLRIPQKMLNTLKKNASKHSMHYAAYIRLCLEFAMRENPLK